MRRDNIGLVLLLLSVSPEASAGSLPSHMEQLMDAAVNASNEVRAAKHNALADQEGVKQAESARWPTLSIGGSAGYRSLIDEGQFASDRMRGQNDRIHMRFTYDLDIHDRRNDSVRLAKAVLEETRQHQVRTVRATRFAVGQAYITAYHTSRMVGLHEKNIEDLAALLDKASILLALGQTDKGAVHAIAKDLGLAHAARARHLSDLDMSIKLLESLTGQSIDPTSLVNPRLRDEVPESLEQSLSLALERDPELKIARARERQTSAQEKIAQKEEFPSYRIEAVASRGRFDDDRTRDLTILFHFEMRLVDGGASSARTQEAHERAEASRHIRQHRTVVLGRETSKLWDDLRATLKAERLDMGALAQAKAHLLAVQNQVTHQERPVTALLHPQQSVVNAEFRILQAGMGIDLISFQLLRDSHM